MKQYILTSVKHRFWKVEKKTKRTSPPTDHLVFFRVRRQNVILHFDVLPVFSKYVRSTCYFFPPPPQFSKILLKWGGGGNAKKYCTVTFLRPPPNRVTKGGVMSTTHCLSCFLGTWTHLGWWSRHCLCPALSRHRRPWEQWHFTMHLPHQSKNHHNKFRLS